MFNRLLVLTIAFVVSNTALAAEDKCKAGPRDQWQSMTALEKRLVAEGWNIKATKIDKGCYEVYGTDGKGQRAEAYFNPKTLDAIKN